MEEYFFEFHRPSEEAFKKAWPISIFVLDTSVLLNIYRIPQKAQEELLSFLRAIEDRLWIPHHVALEYQRRRIGVMSNTRKIRDDAIKVTRQLVSTIKEKIDEIQIDKHGLEISPNDLIKDLQVAANNIATALEKIRDLQPEIWDADPIRGELNKILNGRIGPAPKSQAEIDKMLEFAADRFQNKIPPGFSDEDKDKDPQSRTFSHNGIKYISKYSDLVVWLQIIEHAKKENISHLIFITNDKKIDWWWREEGKTFGPRPELRREISASTNIEFFWMYDSGQFLLNANRYAHAKVSNESVEKVEESIKNEVTSWASKSPILTYSPTETYRFRRRPKSDRVLASVREWLEYRYGNVQPPTDSNYDFGVDHEGHRHAFVVKSFFNLTTSDILYRLRTSFIDGDIGRIKKKYDYFSIIIVTLNKTITRLVEDESIQESIRALLENHLVKDLHIGILIDDQFESVLEFHSQSDENSE